jgi:hypothetical protein
MFSAKGGMRTNGPCRCMENAGFHGSAVMAAKQMLREVLLLRAELAALKAAHVWIKTSERMPPRGSVVLVLCDNGHIGTGQCIVVGDPTGPAYRWYLSASGSIELTEYAVAWMPLPEAPK